MSDGSSVPFDAIAGAIKSKEIQSPPPEDEIFQQAIAWHREFDAEKWQGKKSFHNADHPPAVEAAADKLIAEAQKLVDIPNPTKEQIAEHDPTGIVRSVQAIAARLNLNIDLKRSMELFVRAKKIGIGTHDLGNIMQAVKEEQGRLVPQWNEKYQAAGAEERSKLIATEMINRSQLAKQLNADELRFVMTLVTEFHEQTKFKFKMTDADREAPFGQFAPFVDQLGSELETDPNIRQERVEGLWTEMKEEKADAVMAPDYSRNFVRRRYPEILPDNPLQQDKSPMQRVLAIMDTDFPPEEAGYRKDTLLISEMLANPDLEKTRPLLTTS